MCLVVLLTILFFDFQENVVLFFISSCCGGMGGGVADGWLDVELGVGIAVFTLCCRRLH